MQTERDSGQQMYSSPPGTETDDEERERNLHAGYLPLKPDEDYKWGRSREKLNFEPRALHASRSFSSFDGSDVSEGDHEVYQTQVIEEYVSEKTYYINVLSRDERDELHWIFTCFQGWPLLNNVQWLLAEARLYFGSSGYRSYDNYIGKCIFPYPLEEIKRQVMISDRVQRVIESAQDSRYFRRPTLHSKAEQIFDRMATDFKYSSATKAVAYFINCVFQQFYRGLHVHEEDFERLRKVAMKAQNEGVSLVFIPSHKSHFDYLVLAYIFFRLGISLPHIAAGDNLKMPFVGEILRWCGAFFIRREWGEDNLYKAIVTEYLEVLLKNGYNLEFFIEGGRSRTGKLLKPKFGFLKMITDLVLSNAVRDVILVPISIGHDRVMETEGFVNELLGQKKKKETVTGLAQQSAYLINPPNMGRINIRIAKPFSLREYIELQQEQRHNFHPEIRESCKSLLLKALGYRILDDINCVTVITPTMLVGTVLLTTRGRGIARDELIKKVDSLRAEIIYNGGKVAKFRVGTTGEVVDRAVRVLGDLVQINVLTQPVYIAAKRFELSYYRNAVSHIFVRQSLVALSLYAHIKSNKGKTSEVRRSKLIDNVEYLTQLLKLEFVFKRQSDLQRTLQKERGEYNEDTLQVNFEEGMDALIERNILKAKGDMIELFPLELESWSEKYAFLCMLMWPIVESYWLASVGLLSLEPYEVVDERMFLADIQEFATTLYYQGDLNYYESVSGDALVNSYVRFRDMGIINRVLCHQESKKPVYVISLTEPFRDPEKIRSVCLRIGKFRRIGRYRKEAQDLSERILNLAKLSRKRVQRKRAASTTSSYS
eukprot:Nk52_evm43s2209 gene=Nk52_evmTU43s2209